MSDFYRRIKKIKNKEEKLIIGLMSGTSLDGLDIVLCRFKGFGVETKVKLLAFETFGYDDNVKKILNEICFNEKINLFKLTLSNVKLATLYAKFILEFLANIGVSPTEVDMIASHGQTVYHIPKADRQKTMPATLQIVDGDLLASYTGIVTISDFRMKHIARGGEGAPLAPYGDVFLFSNPLENTLLFNVGGITNFSFIAKYDSEEKNAFSDIGPGNTLMNQWALHKYGLDYDMDGKISAKGQLDKKLLDQLMSHPFVNSPMPKTTGPETFNLKKCLVLDHNVLSSEDIMATLNYFTATVIAGVINKYAKFTPKIVVTGGGASNSHLMKNINELTEGVLIETSLPNDVNPNAKEAIIFAMFANEWFNEDVSPYDQYGLLPVKMGKWSFP